MKRTRKLLAAALAAVLALTMLAECSQTENIYNTIVTPAAEPDPITVYYVQVINEEHVESKNHMEGAPMTYTPITVLANAELDEKAKEVAALIEESTETEKTIQEVIQEVMKDYPDCEVFHAEVDCKKGIPAHELYRNFEKSLSIYTQKAVSECWMEYPAFTVGTARYGDTTHPFRLMLIVGHKR